MPVRLCSKSFKLGFSSKWTENFQMYKLDLEKAEKPEIKWPNGSQKMQGNSRITTTSASLTSIKTLTMWIMTNSEKFLKRILKNQTTLLASWETCMWIKKQQCVQKQRHYSADKGPNSQDYGLPSGRIQFLELDHKQSRMPKNWCLQNVVLEKTPKSPLDSKEIKPVNLKGEQPWIFTERTDAEAEAPVFWSSDVHKQITGKVPDAGKDQGQKEKRVSEDEMPGQHHQCNEHELGQTPGDGEGQGALAFCSPRGCRESAMTGWLNNSKGP